MSRLEAELAEVLEPVRDLAIGQLLHELARALERGADVRQEPMIRDRHERVVRQGALHLPQRSDLAVTEGGQTVMQRVEAVGALSFEPVQVTRREGLVALVRPFSWDAARLVAETPEASPNWTPLRLWFLEAFQSRYGELAPDLDGAVHALAGPEKCASGWAFKIDLGSAPVDTVGEMIDAFAQSGVRRLVFGAAEPVAGSAPRD